jgi:ABC-type molybdate transport system substrate-binding protein
MLLKQAGLFQQAGWLFCAAALLASCGSSPRTPEAASKLTVAAAANLSDVFGQVGPAFKAQEGIDVVFSYGATA